MKQFAKIFESKIFGQLLVKLDTNDDEYPEIRVYFLPDGYGLSSVCINGKDDSDETFASIQKIFDEITLEGCEKMLDHLKSSVFIPSVEN